VRHGPLTVSLNLVRAAAISAVQPGLGKAVTCAFSSNLVSRHRIGLAKRDRANFGGKRHERTKRPMLAMHKHTTLTAACPAMAGIANAAGNSR
jgi:hypothetical protein